LKVLEEEECPLRVAHQLATTGRSIALVVSFDRCPDPVRRCSQHMPMQEEAEEYARTALDFLASETVSPKARAALDAARAHASAGARRQQP
jgi:thioesterase domain-containing protein